MSSLLAHVCTTQGCVSILGNILPGGEVLPNSCMNGLFMLLLLTCNVSPDPVLSWLVARPPCSGFQELQSLDSLKMLKLKHVTAHMHTKFILCTCTQTHAHTRMYPCE